MRKPTTSKQKWKEGLDDRGPFLGHNGRKEALVETTLVESRHKG